MNQVLRILHLEDDPDYSDLVKEMLEREGLRVERVLVDNYANFIAALEKYTRPRDKFGTDVVAFSKTNHLGTNRARLSQVHCGSASACGAAWKQPAVAASVLPSTDAAK